MLDYQRGTLSRNLVKGEEMILFLFQYVLFGMEAPVAIRAETEHILHQIISSLGEGPYMVDICIQVFPLFLDGKRSYPLWSIDSGIADLTIKVIPAFEYFLKGGAAYVVSAGSITELLARGGDEI